MDYGKSGAPKLGGNRPRHNSQDAKGAPSTSNAKEQDKKAALLKRMQAAAARKSEEKE